MEVHMAVYVDPCFRARWLHGLACHMAADSLPELLEFAARIGVKASWIQPATARRREHFDLTPRLKRLALEAGAVELARRAFAAKMRRER